MIGMHPRSMLHDITECAHLQIYNTVEAIQGWVQRIAMHKGEEIEREVDNVSELLWLRDSSHRQDEIPKADQPGSADAGDAT